MSKFVKRHTPKSTVDQISGVLLITLKLTSFLLQNLHLAINTAKMSFSISNNVFHFFGISSYYFFFNYVFGVDPFILDLKYQAFNRCPFRDCVTRLNSNT